MTGHFDRFDRPNLHFDFQLNFTPQCQVNKFWWRFLQRCKNTSHSKTQARQQQQPLLNKNLRSQTTKLCFTNFQSGLLICAFHGPSASTIDVLWFETLKIDKICVSSILLRWQARFSNSNSLRTWKKNSYLSATS